MLIISGFIRKVLVSVSQRVNFNIKVMSQICVELKKFVSIVIED